MASGDLTTYIYLLYTINNNNNKITRFLFVFACIKDGDFSNGFLH